MNPASGPFAENLKALMALGRYGRGEEIAAMVAYLGRSRGRFRHRREPDDRRRFRRMSMAV